MYTYVLVSDEYIRLVDLKQPYIKFKDVTFEVICDNLIITDFETWKHIQTIARGHWLSIQSKED